MSKKPWHRCAETGEPQSLIVSSDWISLRHPRRSLEEKFPGYDTFCLTCCAIMAEYNPNHVRYDVVFDGANPLQLGSAQVVTGKPAEGYVFAGISSTLIAVGNLRRQHQSSKSAEFPMIVVCPRCGRSHSQPYRKG